VGEGCSEHIEWGWNSPWRRGTGEVAETELSGASQRRQHLLVDGGDSRASYNLRMGRR
jgi:hypothetical protein